MIKRCNKCNTTKFILDYQLRKDTGKYRNGCKQCLSKQKAANYKDNRESRLLQAAQRRKDNPEYMINYRIEKKQELKEYSARYREEHLEECRERVRKYSKGKGRAVKTAIENARRATKVNATPEWSEKEEIKELYKQCDLLSNYTGIQHHVHHRIPVKEFDDKVVGLHVLNNLEIVDEFTHRDRHKELREIFGQ